MILNNISFNCTIFREKLCNPNIFTLKVFKKSLGVEQFLNITYTHTHTHTDRYSLAYFDFRFFRSIHNYSRVTTIWQYFLCVFGFKRQFLNFYNSVFLHYMSREQTILQKRKTFHDEIQNTRKTTTRYRDVYKAISKKETMSKEQR